MGLLWALKLAKQHCSTWSFRRGKAACGMFLTCRFTAGNKFKQRILFLEAQDIFSAVATSTFIYPNTIVDLLLEQIYRSIHSKEVERNGKEFGLELIHPSVLSSSAVIPLKSAWREKGTDQNSSDVDPHTITKCDMASLPPAAKPCWGGVCSFCGLNQLLFAKLSPQ